jgi:predicted Fe-Mo cluster-binding NifX family protein
MKTILVPVFNQRISSRLDCTDNFKIVKIEKNVVKDIESIQLVAKNQLEKLNLIITMKPDTVICNGLTDLYKNEFLKNKIKIIPWIHGSFEDVIQNFVKGKLVKISEKQNNL